MCRGDTESVPPCQFALIIFAGQSDHTGFKVLGEPVDVEAMREVSVVTPR